MESKVATIVKKMSNSVSVEFDDVVKNKKMILKSREECLFYLNHFINRAKEEDDYYTETYDVDLFHFVFDDRHLINKFTLETLVLSVGKEKLFLRTSLYISITSFA